MRKDRPLHPVGFLQGYFRREGLFRVSACHSAEGGPLTGSENVKLILWNVGEGINISIEVLE